MSSSDLKDGIIEFIKRYYQRNRKAPSLRTITGRFHIGNGTFYRLFQGIPDACQQAQVPVPESRMRQVSRARRASHRTSHPETDETLREQLYQLQGLLGARSIGEAVTIAADICRSMMPYAHHYKVRNPTQILDRIQSEHQAEQEQLRTEMTRKDAMLESISRERDTVTNTLESYTSHFGDDFFESVSYEKLIVAYQYFQRQGGYGGSFTDMLVQCVELFLHSRDLDFVTLRDRG